MSKFRVGDVCVGQNFVICTECNGMECVVVEIKTRPLLVRCSVTGKITREEGGYIVHWADGDRTFQFEHELRLKRPPSWDRWLYDTSAVDSEEKVPA